MQICELVAEVKAVFLHEHLRSDMQRKISQCMSSAQSELESKPITKFALGLFDGHFPTKTKHTRKHVLLCLTDDRGMKLDIHNHILPASWPNLSEVSFFVMTCRDFV